MTTIRDKKFVKEFSETLAQLDSLLFKLPDEIANREFKTLDELAELYAQYEASLLITEPDDSGAGKFLPPAISEELTHKFGFIIYSRRLKNERNFEKYAGYLCNSCDKILTREPIIIVERTHPKAIVSYTNGEFRYMYFCPVKKKYLPYPDLTKAQKLGLA